MWVFWIVPAPFSSLKLWPLVVVSRCSLYAVISQQITHSARPDPSFSKTKVKVNVEMERHSISLLLHERIQDWSVASAVTVKTLTVGVIQHTDGCHHSSLLLSIQMCRPGLTLLWLMTCFSWIVVNVSAVLTALQNNSCEQSSADLVLNTFHFL